MIELRFGTEDLLRCRFAISPLSEALEAVRALAQPARHAYHLQWLRAVTPRLDLAAFAELLALARSTAYYPDFLSPPPDTPLGDVEEQLTVLRGTEPAQVEREIGWSLGADRPPALAEPVAARALLAEQMERAWTTLIEPDWPALRDLLQADILFRARLLAEGGTRALFEKLHPRVRFARGAVRVSGRVQKRYDLGGEGLLLVPSAFVWPRIGVMMVPPWQPALVYPARGIAALWTRPEPRAGLAGVLGRTRARLLAGLVEPATTTALARRVGAAPSTVSGHLRALQGGGLVSRRRDGKLVHYALTPLGYALLGGSE